jgi:transposase
MSRKGEVKHRARYTLEFKLEAVRLVKAGQEASVTARVVGIPKQTPSKWVRLAERGELQAVGDRPVSAEQMELARLRVPCVGSDRPSTRQIEAPTAPTARRRRCERAEGCEPAAELARTAASAH